jgi:hypothetical protein
MRGWATAALRWGLAGVLVLAAGTGCRRSGPAQAEDTVRRFFAALPAGDCGQLGPLLAPLPAGTPGCTERVAELNRHRVQLLEVVSVQADGRTPDAMLVRARLAQGGVARAEPSILRVERHEGAWRLKL